MGPGAWFLCWVSWDVSPGRHGGGRGPLHGFVVIMEAVSARSGSLLEVLIITTLLGLAVEAKGSAGLGVALNDLVI